MGGKATTAALCMWTKCKKKGRQDQRLKPAVMMGATDLEVGWGLAHLDGDWRGGAESGMFPFTGKGIRANARVGREGEDSFQKDQPHGLPAHPFHGHDRAKSG